MSLIIDMLKDLDKRHHHGKGSTAALALTPRYTTAKFRLNKKPLVLMIIALATMIIAYGILHKRSARQLLPIPTEVAAVKSDTSTAINNDASALQPVMINGVTYETDNAATKITFQLTHDTLYRLISNEQQHSLTLFIDNASMQSDLPTLIGNTVGILSMTSVANKDSLKFQMKLKPGVFLQSAELNKDTKTPELVLTIGNPVSPEKSPEKEVIKTTNNIKSPALQMVVTDQYESAVKLAAAGNQAEAMAILTKLLRYYPDYNDARVALAAIVLEAGNPVQARKIIDDGLAKAPDYWPLIELKARLLTAEGKINEALLVLQSEQPSITDAPNYHALIAAIYNRQDNFELASAIYQRLVSINPHEGSWWFGYGVSLDKLGRSQDAVFAYTKAITEGRLSTQATAFLQNRLRTLQEESHATT